MATRNKSKKYVCKNCGLSSNRLEDEDTREIAIFRCELCKLLYCEDCLDDHMEMDHCSSDFECDEEIKEETKNKII
jgi:rubredoxin